MGIVIFGYVAAFLVSAALLFNRYMLYRNHAEEAAAAGGMYAFGDLILESMIVALFLIPTFVLALTIRDSEAGSTRYSQVLLGISLTAPLSLVFIIPAVTQLNDALGWIAFYRLWDAPLFFVGLVFCRLFALFPRAKRLLNYALLVEGGSLVLIAGFIVFAFVYWGARR